MMKLHALTTGVCLVNRECRQEYKKHCHFTALCPGLPRWAGTRKDITHSHPKRVVGVCHDSGFYEAWER